MDSGFLRSVKNCKIACNRKVRETPALSKNPQEVNQSFLTSHSNAKIDKPLFLLLIYLIMLD